MDNSNWQRVPRLYQWVKAITPIDPKTNPTEFFQVSERMFDPNGAAIWVRGKNTSWFTIDLIVPK